MHEVRNPTLFSFTAPVLVAAMALAPLGAQAADSDDLSVGLGIGGGLTPEYRGADSYEGKAIPWVEARKGRVAIDPVQGLRVDMLTGQNWSVAAAVSYARGRDNTAALAEFEDVDGSVMAGALFSWKPGSWQLTGDIGAPVSGDLEGVRVRGYLRYRGALSQQWVYAFGPSFTWGNKDWNEMLFNVSAKDATRSGLSQYQTDGSYFAGSMNARLTYLLTPKLSVSAVTRYTRLTGDAADSPIVADVGDANQWLGSMAVNYRF
ncbi:MipA/OmpV family protein [Marinobacter fuscus]|uniref:MipA/OmpV family protein n=1 Tax=Marinobacter fuscus TaxID=2109942 RepID=A0A2T1K4C6_9GAMM|nr:MipA/OmpV family protein [Marinobacter fuscus]PSF05024.1 MipA/OmpV family protein [Marinobacter fuscus]